MAASHPIFTYANEESNWFVFLFSRCIMNYDLMSVNFSYLFVICLLWTIQLYSAEQTTIYVKRGDTVELCDNRPTSIYAYEYRSFDGQRNSIIEPKKNPRYSNPYNTSVLRIRNTIESDSGYFKCPQDDTEWQRLQVYSKFTND